MDRVQGIKAFEEIVFDALNEFINDDDMYPSDAVLQINTQSHEILIDSPTTDVRFDNISLSGLISTEESVIDNDAINELASKYFFVR